MTQCPNLQQHLTIALALPNSDLDNLYSPVKAKGHAQRMRPLALGFDSEDPGAERAEDSRPVASVGSDVKAEVAARDKLRVETTHDPLMCPTISARPTNETGPSKVIDRLADGDRQEAPSNGMHALAHFRVSMVRHSKMGAIAPGRSLVRYGEASSPRWTSNEITLSMWTIHRT